ncbi:MAG: MBL fold metallo-hydrolase [Candidatus Liptonbacteria bacterium]|nr:MBL fold metallo-hydrolase [Candidatus Pacearchaeota archaeon]MBM3257022.1 MBL fold metallo-hydrolase [Candidatus Liptonbacteria bacterium]
MKIKDVIIEFLGHDGFLISNSNGKRIAIDPYNVSDAAGKADYILVTHSHSDHCSIKDIAKMSKKGTTIITSPDAQSKITRIDDVQMQIMEIGDELEMDGVKIEAVPAYNVGNDFHPKSERWLGFVIKFNGVIIYHAGDTDKIPDMERLTGYGKHGNEFVALLPVSGTYVMTAEDAADVAKMLGADLAIPMHYGSGVVGTIDDAKRFESLCLQNGINSVILERV